MSDDLAEHRVAMVVFVTADAVDFTDAVHVAETAIRQSLGTCAIEDPHHLTVSARFANHDPAKVHVHKLREVGAAMGNGYLKTTPTDRAYREGQ